MPLNSKNSSLLSLIIFFFPKASINVLLNIIHRKDAEGEGAAGTGRRRRREGGLLLRPIICICNDQLVSLACPGRDGELRPLPQARRQLLLPPAKAFLCQVICRQTCGLAVPYEK